MNLLTKGDFAKLTGVSAPAISKALRKDSSGNSRLETFQGTSKIDADAPLSKSYRENIGYQRKNNVPVVPGVPGVIVSDESNEDLTKAITKTQLAQVQKIIEAAELTKQKRIEKELKNAVRRGELVEVEAIEQTLMMWIDRWYNTNKRIFSAFFDEMQRTILARGENCPELKREFLNKLESAADEAKNTTCDKLEEIQIDQGKR